VNRPSNSDFTLGHRLGVALSAGAAAYATFVWATQPISWLVPAFCLLVCKAAVSARKRVVAYKTWRAAWDDMAGVAPTQDAPKRKPRGKQWVIAGCLGWLFMTSWLIFHAGETSADYNAVGAVWMLGSTLGAGAALLQLLRSTLRPSKATGAARSHVVSVCLPVPGLWGSPPVRRMKAALPEYCRALLSHSNAAPSPSGDAQHAPSPTTQ
jgi:hypothetical protein